MKYEWYETGQDVLSTVGTGGTLIHNACFSHLILIKHNNFHLFSSEGILKQYCYEYFNTILLSNFSQNPEINQGLINMTFFHYKS